MLNKNNIYSGVLAVVILVLGFILLFYLSDAAERGFKPLRDTLEGGKNE